ncbi:MAG: hypothetical protein ACOCRX_05690 [Candidatus Woesearchaeota archaeon]
MESLRSLEEYFERFHSCNFEKFINLYLGLYSDDSNLQDKIEFSTLINQMDESNLRFGMFKLYNPKTIASFLKNMDYEISNLEGILSFAQDFVPEMALGFDFNKNNSRVKIYLLRLPDNPGFNSDTINKINDFLMINSINPINFNNEELKKCYILGIDFYRTANPNVKIYIRDENVDISKTRNYLANKGINSKFLHYFSILESNGILKDTTVSNRYSNNNNKSNGVSVFFEVADNSNSIIEEMIGTCIPERINGFKEMINTLEVDKPVRYSHVGLTFSEKYGQESLCVYYSPVIEVQK